MATSLGTNAVVVTRVHCTCIGKSISASDGASGRMRTCIAVIYRVSVKPKLRISFVYVFSVSKGNHNRSYLTSQQLVAAVKRLPALHRSSVFFFFTLFYFHLYLGSLNLFCILQSFALADARDDTVCNSTENVLQTFMAAL